MNKYNVPTPRYTSYPTVPYWNDSIDIEKWQQLFIKRMDECNQDGGISVYIHLPFCEKLCTFCGCNKKITTNHGVENEYIIHLLKEWKNYRSLMQEPPVISELHIGGGTPTFFSPDNLKYLLKSIFS
ncbi:MAG: coproporphyrinogen III oxidase, partial [Sphingobacteriia bacterium 39-36-14]